MTLYVGYGTFSPVRCEDIRNHQMHREYVELPEETADAIAEAKARHRPVIAVGTTSVRTLEGVAQVCGRAKPFAGWTDIFLYPGRPFRVVDGIITNFHLPESSLLMLVSAFAGRKRILEAYQGGREGRLPLLLLRGCHAHPVGGIRAGGHRQRRAKNIFWGCPAPAHGGRRHPASSPSGHETNIRMERHPVAGCRAMRNLYRSGEQHVANCFSGRTLQGLRPVRSGLPGAHHSPLGTVQPPGL